MESDWARPWLPGVLASDASLSGYGVAQSFWNPSDVATVGRIAEVRRWRCGAVLARRHAFESAGSRVDSCSGEVLRDCFGRPIPLDPELAEKIASESWETDPSFPEVPSRLLSSHSWIKVMADTWFFDVDIVRLEAQALLEAAERSAHSQVVHDCRMLLLSDKISIVLCFTRGRSRDLRLHSQVSRFASVWRATSGSASNGYRASSTPVTRGSREHDSASDSYQKSRRPPRFE